MGILKIKQLLMDIKDIQHLIKFVAKSGAQEVKLEMEDVKITIKTGSSPQQVEAGFVQQIQAVPAPVAVAAPAATPAAIPSAENEEKNSPDDNHITIKSPIIGTFTEKLLRINPLLLKLVIL
jgi:acetyl-CoA carboxylase biotin carboxyl carrier protein